MVMMTSSRDGAHSTHTVRATGSSRDFSRASAARSWSRSASSMMMTRQRPTEGRSAASWTRSRASATVSVRPSVAMMSTSEWVPSTAVRHSRQVPQPPWGHCSAPANARAATERPDPGGPVSSHSARNLPYAAGFAAAYGLPYDDALKAITLNVAEMFGFGDKLGSLDVGKMANVVVANGDPLDVRTDVKQVYIQGVPVPMVTRQTRLRDEYSK